MTSDLTSQFQDRLSASKVGENAKGFMLNLHCKDFDDANKRAAETESAKSYFSTLVLQNLRDTRDKDQEHIQSVILGSEYKWAISDDHRKKIVKGSNDMKGKMVGF